MVHRAVLADGVLHLAGLGLGVLAGVRRQFLQKEILGQQFDGLDL